MSNLPCVFWMLDDDPEDAFLVGVALERLLYPVTFQHFYTSVSFFEYQQTLPVQYFAEHKVLLLLDLNMPGQNGLDCLKILRSNRAYDALVVVIFSTSNMEEEKQRSVALGANAHLGKPDTVEQLVEALDILYRQWLMPSH